MNHPLRNLAILFLTTTTPASADTITAQTIGCPQKGQVKEMMSIGRQSGNTIAGQFAQRSGCMVIPAGKQADYISGDGWAGEVQVRPKGSVNSYWINISDYK